MYKKLFGALLLICSLMVFSSCQQDSGKKDTDKSTKSMRSSSYHRQDYRNKNKDGGATMPSKCKKSCPCPKGKPCSCPKPCPAKKTCPNGCKKKCCINENKDEAISNPQEDKAIQETQETVSVNEVQPDIRMPLEELKASLEKSDALDRLNTEL